MPVVESLAESWVLRQWLRVCLRVGALCPWLRVGALCWLRVRLRVGASCPWLRVGALCPWLRVGALCPWLRVEALCWLRVWLRVGASCPWLRVGASCPWLRVWPLYFPIESCSSSLKACTSRLVLAAIEVRSHFDSKVFTFVLRYFLHISSPIMEASCIKVERHTLRSFI